MAPAGGIYFWARLPPGVRSAELLELGIANGVAFAAGDVFYADGAGSDHLRLCFANLNRDRIEEGVRRLPAALARVTRGARADKRLPLV